MSNSELSQIQKEILKALKDLGEKSTYSEFILAKKIRENAKISGKQKAGIGLKDLEKVLDYLEQNEQIFYALHLNSSNDILIQKSESSVPLTLEAHQRRLKSEKSMSIFTNRDLNSKSTNNKPKKRTERRSININSNFEDW